jgi:hypothetical protein
MSHLNGIQQNIFEILTCLAKRNDLTPPRIGGWVTLSNGTMRFIEGVGKYNFNGEKFQWVLL